MGSRKLEDLTDYMKGKCLELIRLAKKQGIDIMVTSTARYFKEQVAFYAQNRQPLEEVNKLRALAGMEPITASENKYCVTWTMLSKHLINLDDNIITNDKSHAFDFVVLKDDGQVTWDIKVNVNKNDIPDYKEVGLLAESIGLVAGMRFKDKRGRPRPDYPHIQQPENIK